MACFTRFFNGRQKNSFSPEKDENKDTVLKNDENTVQIGRYIRRDENSLFTPKSSQSLRAATQRQSILQHEQQQATVAASSSYQQTSPLPQVSTTINGLTGIQAIQANKKLSSTTNDRGVLPIETSYSKANGNIPCNNTATTAMANGGTVQAKYHLLHQQHPQVTSKLKPVKERRPTALPTEQPKIDNYEDTLEKQQNSRDVLDASLSTTTTEDGNTGVANGKPARFFIGAPKASGGGVSNEEHSSDSDNDDVIVVVADALGETVNDDGTRGVSSLSLKQQQNVVVPLIINSKYTLSTGSASATASASASAASTPLPSPSIQSSLAPSPLLAARSAASTTSTKLRTKFPSNSSNKLRKFGRTDTATSALSQHVEVEKVHIPPPPPLPPQPLCVPCTSPSPSLISKSKRNSNLFYESQTVMPVEMVSVGSVAVAVATGRNSASVCTTSTLAETDVKTQTSPTSTSTSASASAASASASVSLSVTHDGRKTNERLTEDSETAITLHEALQSQCDDDVSSLAASSTQTATETENVIKSPSSSSLNDARDSGVQSEESSPSSPKESDSSNSSPKSHRIEGGLIFARTNLPKVKDVQIDYIEKDEKTRNLIRQAIEKNDFLNNYMDNDRKVMVIDAMEMLRFQPNDFIIHENDEGNEIYVSDEGQFDVIKDDKMIGQFAGETVFGELAILYNAKRFASIRAMTEAKVWKIDRDKFRKIMVISGSKESEENLHFLRSAPFLNDLSEEVLSKVVDLLQRKFFATDTCIVREGDIGNEFFIIRGGTVTIKKLNETGEERVVDNRKRGDYFGEQALLNADCRQASVYADAPGTEVLKLDREAFISYLGTIPQLRELPTEKSDTEGRDSNRKSEFDNEYAHIELTDLKKIATLGAGAFGKVDLVSFDSETTFALKIVKKIDIIKQDQIEHIYSEKHVMMKCSSSPFIIELYKTFRNDKFVYFLMEACMGGDVWTVMSQRRFFDEKTARFIAGCVVEAFDFLHSHNIIYRDLKPENLMLTTDGYCKLVDFGFAKHIPANQKTHTFAGTPEYVAPEIILDRGHDRSVDYWALGILVFELLVGKTPFRGQNQIKIYQQILGGIDVVQMPSKIPKSAQNLIRALCKQLPAERLGYQRKGIMEIKKHSWFDSLDWQKLKNKQISSPIKRPINSKTDLQHFGPSGVENEADPPSETSGWDADF